jgi:hypothetical protein
MSRALDIVGLVTNLAGVLILFRYGMPYRVATAGVRLIAVPDVDVAAIKIDKKYRLLGIIGIMLTVLGVVLQIVGEVW